MTFGSADAVARVFSLFFLLLRFTKNILFIQPVDFHFDCMSHTHTRPLYAWAEVCCRIFFWKIERRKELILPQSAYVCDVSCCVCVHIIWKSYRLLIGFCQVVSRVGIVCARVCVMANVASFVSSLAVPKWFTKLCREEVMFTLYEMEKKTRFSESISKTFRKTEMLRQPNFCITSSIDFDANTLLTTAVFPFAKCFWFGIWVWRWFWVCLSVWKDTHSHNLSPGSWPWPTSQYHFQFFLPNSFFSLSRDWFVSHLHLLIVNLNLVATHANADSNRTYFIDSIEWIFLFNFIASCAIK